MPLLDLQYIFKTFGQIKTLKLLDFLKTQELILLGLGFALTSEINI